MGSLNDPAGFAQAAAMRLTPSGDFGRNPSGVQGVAVLAMVVATVCLNEAGLAERSAPFAANGRYGLDQRQELSDVVTIGAGQDDREREPLCFGNEVVF